MSKCSKQFSAIIQDAKQHPDYWAWSALLGLERALLSDYKEEYAALPKKIQRKILRILDNPKSSMYNLSRAAFWLGCRVEVTLRKIERTE